jgi:hypothetical protein
VLLAIGGWSFGTAKFKEVAETRFARQTFIFSAIPYLREHQVTILGISISAIFKFSDKIFYGQKFTRHKKPLLGIGFHFYLDPTLRSRVTTPAL